MEETQIFQSCDTALDNSQLFFPSVKRGQVQQTHMDKLTIRIWKKPDPLATSQAGSASVRLHRPGRLLIG